MKKDEFVNRRKEDAVVFKGTLRDMMELSYPDVPHNELLIVLRYFKILIPDKEE